MDNGQHLLIGGYHETFKFLRRIGASDGVALQSRLAVEFVDRAGSRSQLRSGALPAPLHLLVGIMAWPALDWRDRLAALRIGAAIRVASRGQPRVSGHRATVREWLQQRGQTPRLIELLWGAPGVATLNESIDIAAADPFVAVLARMFGTSRSDSALGLPTRPLDEIYAEPSRRYLERRACVVQVNAPAQIDAAPGGPSRYVPEPAGRCSAGTARAGDPAPGAARPFGGGAAGGCRRLRRQGAEAGGDPLRRDPSPRPRPLRRSLRRRPDVVRSCRLGAELSPRGTGQG